MEIKPTYVSYEQAKLLKEKGFVVLVKAMYHNKDLIYGGFDYNHNNPEEQKLWNLIKLSAPEQWQVVEWLRVNHGIWIVPIYQINGSWGFDIQKLNIKSILDGIRYSHITKCNSPQEAYSAAFNYILKELI